MSNLKRNSTEHIKLFIPGPVEVLPEILDAQAQWMYGHRSQECKDLIGSVHPKIKQVFQTDGRVLMQSGTGSGFWEGALRNCVSKKVLHVTSGAFAEKWAKIAGMNGVDYDVVTVPWNEPVLPEHVVDALGKGEYDAFAIVHNESSTGVINPIKEIAAAIRALPNGDDIMIMVDSVSGLSGAELRFDEWDLDVVLTSSQKALALPPGLGLCAVSDRALEKAKTVKNRGYYYDFVGMAKKLEDNQTPNTSALPLLMALDVQCDRILAEGVEARWKRHMDQRDKTIEYVLSRGFTLTADRKYASPTLTSVDNGEVGMDVNGLNAFLQTKGMVISNGYGNMKNISFRISHMGDIYAEDLDGLFAAMDEFLG